MEIPSGLNPTPRPFSAKSQPVDKMFSQESPKDSFPQRVKDIYFSPTESGQSLAETLTENKKTYAKLLEKAVKEGELSKEDALKRRSDFDKGKIGPYQGERKRAEKLPTVLAQLNDLENEQFCLARLPQQCADGLYRTQDYYVAPGTLALKAAAQGWETSPDKDGQQLPVADLVVIGAGPGGLTTAWQTARRGGRVVCFEAELAGSAFSDAGAKSVHHMRTSADGSNLVRDGHAFATLEHPLSLPGQLSSYRQIAREGREGQQEMTGEEVHDIPEASLDPHGRNAPATRGELFEHLNQLTHSLAMDFKDATLCERSPVNGVTFEDGLFTVTTARGHKVKAKNIVLATGLTGPDGGKGKMLGVFDQLQKQSPDKYLSLSRSGDPQEASEKLGQTEKPSLIISERLLGDQSVRQTIRQLPEGSRAALVGSGSSAVKGALELLALHPGLSVDLFTKGTMEVSQTQLPNENFHQAVLELGTGPEYSEAAAKKLKSFGTPVTPRSLQHLMEAQQSGRLRLLELGQYFDEKSVSLTAGEDGSTQLKIVDPEVDARLKDQAKQFQSKGLLPNDSPPVSGTSYQLLVQAIGYGSKGKGHMLSHLSAEAQAKIHLNTAGQPDHVARTSIPGLSTRGRQLADKIAEEIPSDRRIEITVPQDGRIDWRETEQEIVDGIIVSRGNHPNFVKAIRRQIAQEGSSPQELQLLFPTSDRRLLELAHKQNRTPTEEEILQRGLILSQRMDAYDRQLTEE